LKISNLDVRCDRSQRQHLEIWCECHSVEDVDDLMAWLLLAKDMMKKWDRIRSRRAQASQSPKTTLGKNDLAEQGEIPGQAQESCRANGQH